VTRFHWLALVVLCSILYVLLSGCESPPLRHELKPCNQMPRHYCAFTDTAEDSHE
jgi:hypothetical protein